MVVLVHHPAYDAQSVPDGHRFPMRKYSLVADRLRAAGHAFSVPDAASRADLVRAHKPAYVDAILNLTLDRASARRIGFEITPAIRDRSCAAVGGTLHAAQCALETGAAINLAGGSHHADAEGGAGFCVFNDVAVAAKRMLAQEKRSRIAVIDLDVHQGDGTARIFAGDDRVYTFSMHCEDNWPSDKAQSDLDIGLARGTGDEAYLEQLSSALEQVLAAARPQLVFYNAGVDPHVEDGSAYFH